MSEEHGFDGCEVEQWLIKGESKQAILDAIARPAERTLVWHEYRKRLLTEQRIKQGVEFWAEHRELLDQVSAKHKVPPQYLLGILGVETSYGRNTGKYRVIDALATLGFDYAPRAAYFKNELEQFLLLAREEKLDPLAALGSYAGAMGPPQFMPRSVRKFAVDEDGDGKRDLWGNWADVLGSIAHYFREHGWNPDEPVIVDAEVDAETAAKLNLDPKSLVLNETVGSLQDKGVRFETTLPKDAKAILIAAVEPETVRYRVGFNNFGAITRYNRSVLYAMTVDALANELVKQTLANDTDKDIDSTNKSADSGGISR